MRCCVSMLKMLVYPLLNDATIWLGSLLTRSTEAGTPNSISQNILEENVSQGILYNMLQIQQNKLQCKKKTKLNARVRIRSFSPSLFYYPYLFTTSSTSHSATISQILQIHFYFLIFGYTLYPAYNLPEQRFPCTVLY